MNDRPPPPVSDEDVSAVIDGEADDALAERVHREAADRLEAMEAARRLVAEAAVQPLPPSAVDALVAAALDADPAATDDHELVDRPDGSAPAVAADDAHPAVVPIPDARRPLRRVPAGLVAAAVIAMLLLGLGLIRGGLDSSDQDTAAKFDKVGSSIATDASDSQAAGAESSASGDLAADAPSTTTAAAPDLTAPAADYRGAASVNVTSLGSYPDADALRRALVAGVPESSKRTVAGAAVDRCQQQVGTVLSLTDPPRSVGQAVVGGRSVLVYTYAYSVASDPAVTRLVAAVGEDACDPVLTFQY